jgi:CheY-like chemotaxis protein
VATTILAVDDSAVMRKILEITFAGTEFQLVTAASGQDALAKAKAGVGVILCDNSLDGDGYNVATQLKQAAPNTPLLFLSSRQNPYDAGKGSSAKVDDHIDKPFDTQQMIDRVIKLTGGTVAAAPAPAASAAKSKTIAFGTPAAAATPAPAAAAPAAAPKASGFGSGGLGAKPAAAAPAPAPPAAKPTATATPAAKVAPAPAPAAAAASAAVGAANGQLAAKMGEMGLSSQQADAILALSRDLLEKVIWEVVPALAETLIKEEISRLTK